MTLISKYVKNEENVCEYFSLYPYKSLLKVKELIYYVNFVADDTTKHTDHRLTKKATKNEKPLHQVIKLERQNSRYKHNKPLNFLECIEDHNTLKHFLKTDSELTADDD